MHSMRTTANEIAMRFLNVRAPSSGGALRSQPDNLYPTSAAILTAHWLQRRIMG
jgi:hypothetical protein